MNIVTECHGWDNWTAICYPPSDNGTVGYGHTEQEASDDLKEQMEDRE